jgi:hypothetical protein
VPVRLIPAAVCALGAHALLYGTFRPGDGLHGYLGWYEPALTVAVIATLLVLRPVWLRSRGSIVETARRLSTAALFVLLVQESLEHSLAAGHPALSLLTPSQLLVVVLGVAVTALLLAFALRAGQLVLGLLHAPRTARLLAAARWSVVTVQRGPARPLAERFALRAPPLLAGS